MRLRSHSIARFRLTAAIALAVASVALSRSAQAQSVGESIGGAVDALHLRTTPPPAADFVQKSRPNPETLDYRPLAPTAKPSPKRRTPEQLDALGGELERARERNLRSAARVKIPDAPPQRRRSD